MINIKLLILLIVVFFVISIAKAQGVVLSVKDNVLEIRIAKETEKINLLLGGL